MLAVGTLVHERYEVTQVVSESAGEHIYNVTDHQGYQHCWNCKSEQNSEGDEFCIDCGAELLDESGSATALVTEALLTIVDPAFAKPAWIVTTTEVLAPDARLPKLKVSTPATGVLGSLVSRV